MAIEVIDIIQRIFGKVPEHKGVCGYCRSRMPVISRFCPGCSAYWGYSWRARAKFDQARIRVCLSGSGIILSAFFFFWTTEGVVEHWWPFYPEEARILHIASPVLALWAVRGFFSALHFAIDATERVQWHKSEYA